MEKTATRAGVKEYRLGHWREFFDLAVEDFATAPAYVYRGQSDYAWPVVSSIDRHEKRYPKRKNLGGTNPPFFDTPPFSEGEHLDAYRRAIRGRRGPNAAPLSEDDLWALGQHHGLVTPLLDWTRSPYVALFFAFEEERRLDSDGRMTAPEHRIVYALSTSTIEGSVGAGSSGVRLVSPTTEVNYRLLSQGGIFLKMPRGIDLESHVRKEFALTTINAILVKVKIPNNDRNDCLVALNKMNINYMSLFPDFDGAARHVNSLWQPGHEDSIAYL